MTRRSKSLVSLGGEIREVRELMSGALMEVMMRAFWVARELFGCCSRTRITDTRHYSILSLGQTLVQITRQCNNRRCLSVRRALINKLDGCRVVLYTQAVYSDRGFQCLLTHLCTDCGQHIYLLSRHIYQVFGQPYQARSRKDCAGVDAHWLQPHGH